jgi:hypothetical protein
MSTSSFTRQLPGLVEVAEPGEVRELTTIVWPWDDISPLASTHEGKVPAFGPQNER